MNIALISGRIAEEDDDLARAKPCVDEALAEIARGEGQTLEQHNARVAAYLASLKD